MPGITVLPFLMITVEELIVAGSIAALKDIVIELLRGTALALSAGVVVLTVGVGPGSFFASFLQPAMKKIDANDISWIVFESFIILV